MTARLRERVRAPGRTATVWVAAAKAQIVTAETYARELRLSKGHSRRRRRDGAASGMGSREGKAGQDRGTVAPPAGGRPKTGTAEKTLVADLLPHGGEQAAVYAMTDLEPEQFDEVLTEARAEGNLSRANVARKAREVSGKTRATPRRALPDQFFTATYDAVKKVESLHRLIGDDRFPQNAEKVAAKHRNDLLRTRDLLEQVINALPEKESTRD